LVEVIFLMFVLKLPILYLCAVVYWAVRAEPEPPEPALLPVPADDPSRPRPRRPRRDRRRGGPHGSGRSRRATRAGAR
jgi:hypothetical protein